MGRAPLEIYSARHCRSFVGALGEFNESDLDTFPKGYSMMEILWEMSSGQARITCLSGIILSRSPSGIRFSAGAYRKRAFRGIEPLSGRQVVGGLMPWGVCVLTRGDTL